ncbi:MAG: PQQ-binding-like beta-propeller repeat protein, partial [Acidimicrobiia bacterium]
MKFRMLIGLMSLALAVLAAATPSVADEPWPAFRGPGTTGVSAEQLPEGDGPLAFELVWKRPLGSAYSGISIAGGLVVTGYSDGEHDFVGAFDPQTGEEVWQHAFAPHYKGHDGSHDGTTATPSISGGRVFMASPWGHLVALDLATGEPLWTRHMIDDFGGEKPLYGFAASPLVVGDSVVMSVCSETESIVALDAASGEVTWRSLDRPCGGSQGSPVLMEIEGEAQIVVLAPSGLLAGLDPATGSLSWELELEGRADAMGSNSQSPLALGGNRMLIKHRSGETAVVALEGGAEGLTPSVVASGRGLARSYSPPTLWGDTLFGYSARFLSAVDPSSGELLWRSREPGDGFLLAVDGQLAVITKTGSLHLGAASPEGWQETARLDLFDDLAWSPPSFAGDSIYVRSLGEMARVRLVRREMELTAEVSGPAIPAALAGLVAEVAKGDATAAVDSFLDGRELPLIDGTEVTFLFRGGEDVAIAGEMIGMRREEPMIPLEGTDLWWWSAEIDRRARMSYLFFVGDEPHVDNSHDRHTTSTILGPDMNWFRGTPLEMSWFAMPEWPGLSIEPLDRVGGSRLETIKAPFQPEAGEDGTVPEPVEVTLHVWLPPGYDESDERYPTVYPLNSEALDA